MQGRVGWKQSRDGSLSEDFQIGLCSLVQYTTLSAPDSLITVARYTHNPALERYEAEDTALVHLGKSCASY